MRKRNVAIWAAMMCFVMLLIIPGAKAESPVHVKHVPKNKVGLAMKAVGSFSYNQKLNRWEGVEGLSVDGTDIAKKPVIIQPMFIGKQKLPVYYEAGNMMADPCDKSYIIITDQSYAIIISTDCTGDAEKRLETYAKTFTLPRGVHAVRAKEQAGWKVIE